MNPRSQLYSYCSSQNIFLPKVQRKQLGHGIKQSTHLAMDGMGGGVLIVPDNKYSEFLLKYINDIENGVPLYLIEKRTEWFRWMADLDFFGDRYLTDEEISKFSRKAQDVVKSYYDLSASDMSKEQQIEWEKELFQMLVMTTEPSVNDSGKTKTGIHLVMPNLSVTTEQCLQIRASIVAKFAQLGAYMKGWNSWEDVVDETVYVGSGLRMPMSRKCTKCPDCRGNQENPCLACEGKGRKFMTRVYEPKFYLMSDGQESAHELDELRSSMAQYISKASIRLLRPYKVPKWSVPHDAPAVASHRSYEPESDQIQNNVEMEDLAIMDRRFGQRKPLLPSDPTTRQHLAGQKRKRSSGGASGSSATHSLEIDPTSDMFKAMTNFIRREVHPVLYSMIYIDRMTLHENRKTSYYRIETKGNGSSNCMNLKPKNGKPGRHNNNRIFFLVKKTGLTQRCYCDCVGPEKLSKRHGVLCKDYESKPFKLTLALKKQLFPEAINTTSVMQMHSTDYKSNPEGFKAYLKDSVSQMRAQNNRLPSA